MNWEKLEFKHKSLLYDRFRSIKEPLSEYSFANVYLFRHIHKYEVCTSEPYLIRGKTYDDKIYVMPTQDIRTLKKEFLKELVDEVDFLFPIPESWLGYLEECGIKADYADGDTDYIYTTEKMCTYKGRKLHKKRNLLKNFKLNYNHEGLPLNDDTMDDAKKILEIWQETSGLPIEETDYLACKEALELYDDLVLCGGIYYAEGEPAGFILGEELNEETFVLHFAKGVVKFKGIYQYMYNNFANILPNRYKYLNFEQDLGKMALRMAKTSYIPDNLIKKYRVSCKDK